MYTREQQATHRELWVAALRSGKYPQTIGTLAAYSTNETKYCCLGVACEVAIANGAPIKRVLHGALLIYDGENAVMPASVKHWLGLEGVSGDFVPGKGVGDVDCIAAANDELKWDFNKIADFIEAGGLKLEAT